MYYQGQSYLPFTNLSFDLIWAMVILCTIKLLIICFKKLECIQYNPYLALTEAIRGTSKKKKLSRIGIEVSSRLTLLQNTLPFYMILENEHPNFPFNLIPARPPLYSTRNMHNNPLLNTNHNFFKNSFFPYTIIQRNNLDHRLRKSESFSTFETDIAKFM